MSKKSFFAQTYTCDPSKHKSKHFSMLEEAIQWVEEQGGGVVKKRNAKKISQSGYGLGRVIFDPPMLVYGEVYQSKIK